MDFSIQQLSTFELIIAGIFIFSALVQLSYYLIVFSKLAFYNKAPDSGNESQPVSVVISAHDEDYNLQNNLPSILNQDYPEFEVIVVNHASTDDTSQILFDLKRQHNHLKIVNIEQDLNFFKGKKFPLSIGIKSAKHEILLLTDADCKPISNNWIKSMVSNYTSKTEVILGYGPYNKSKGLLNLIIRYDTFMIAMQYFSFSLLGIPYMGVGRNLSYRRSTFFKNKGFTSHYNISSGDDDLFIQQVADNKNTKIEVSNDSFMYSNAMPNFTSWLTQKQRHLSTGSSYSTLFKILLSAFSISQLLFYVTLIILLISVTLIVPTLIIMIITISARVFIQKKAASKLGENQLFLFSLIGDVLYVMLLPIITFISLIRKTNSWK
ncbi:MAG: glycosyltransferase [Bacteroidota bacterium]